MLNIFFPFPAKHNETEVNITQRFRNDSQKLSESQHLQVHVVRGDYISIRADKPVMVLQYVVPSGAQDTDCYHSNNNNNNSSDCASFMLMVPPMEQQENQYLFSTLNTTEKQNVNLVISSNLTDGVLLDGEPILGCANATEDDRAGGGDSAGGPIWTTIDAHAEVNYSAIQFSVDGGLHNLSHESPQVLFSATSYGYPLGMKLLDLPVVGVAGGGGYQYVPAGKVSGGSPGEEEEYLSRRYRGNSAGGDGLSSSVIAVIVSLCSGVFFVIVCIVGFVIAEFFCNGKEPSIFSRAKIAPFNA